MAGSVLVTNDTAANDHGAWGGALIGGGAGLVLTGPLLLILPSPIESSLAQHQASKPQTPTLQLGVNGLGLSASGSF